ncbi:TPA: hypothetical protein QHS21_002524 [Klebsiella michiganensis]|nr:hypothetical protein [Klebsiella michiganensis]
MLKGNVMYKGIPVNGAGISVGVINISEDKTVMSFIVNYTAPGSDIVFDQETFSCDYDLDGPNPEENAYTHLKTLSKFSDAIEV